MKKVLLIAIVLVTTTVFGQLPRSYQHNRQTHVDDYADVFTDDQEQQMDNLIRNYKQFAEINVATVSNTAGLGAKEFAKQLGNHFGVGDKLANNGIEIVLCVPERKVGSASGIGLSGILTDIYCQQVLDDAKNAYFKSGAYFDGMAQILNKYADALDQQVKTPGKPDGPTHSAGSEVAERKEFLHNNADKAMSADTVSNIWLTIAALFMFSVIFFWIYNDTKKKRETERKRLADIKEREDMEKRLRQSYEDCYYEYVKLWRMGEDMIHLGVTGGQAILDHLKQKSIPDVYPNTVPTLNAEEMNNFIEEFLSFKGSLNNQKLELNRVAVIKSQAENLLHAIDDNYYDRLIDQAEKAGDTLVFEDDTLYSYDLTRLKSTGENAKRMKQQLSTYAQGQDYDLINKYTYDLKHAHTSANDLASRLQEQVKKDRAKVNLAMNAQSKLEDGLRGWERYYLLDGVSQDTVNETKRKIGNIRAQFSGFTNSPVNNYNLYQNLLPLLNNLTPIKREHESYLEAVRAEEERQRQERLRLQRIEDERQEAIREEARRQQRIEDDRLAAIRAEERAEQQRIDDDNARNSWNDSSNDDNSDYGGGNTNETSAETEW